MSRNRFVNVYVFLVIVVVVAVISWFAGSQIMSPAEAAARTAPPTPSPILVPVELRVLSSDIVTRGTARYGLPQQISLAPSELKTSTAVVTSLPAHDTQLDEGDVLLTISGRPVFVLVGDIPMFRDLTLGLTGDDVRQLEQALSRMGRNPGTIDGVYDQQTSDAVEAWYRDGNWTPFEPSAEQRAEIRALEDELSSAINRQLAAAEALQLIPLTYAAVQAEAERANRAANADLDETNGRMQAVNADANATSEQRDNASTAVELARSAANAAQLAGEAAMQSVINDRQAAEREAEAAADAVAEMNEALNSARSIMGVQIPANEIVFVRSLPARVDQIDVAIGDAAVGNVMTVTNNQLMIDTSLPLEEAPLVSTGLEVLIDEPDLEISATGEISFIADSPGTFGVDGFHIYVEIRVDETELSLAGFSLRLTIPVESTGGEVLAVPISAVTLAADGTSRIQVEQNGELEYVTIESGLSADGYVEVRPVEADLTEGQMVVIGFETTS